MPSERSIDADTITQAVIARHAGAADARLRELMTCLVQHLHAFARETRLTEREWSEGVRYLAETGQRCNGRRQELMLLSDVLGLTTLVSALNRRRSDGCTEPAPVGTAPDDGTPHDEPDGDGHRGGEPCFVRGRICSPDGSPVAGAELQYWPADAAAAHGTHDARAGPARGVARSGADGGFRLRCVAADPHPIPDDGPVGSLLQALGRHAWRPAHLHVVVTATGHRRLVTHVFRAGSRYLDSDAVFGVRHSLIADWVRHDAGRTPDGDASATPFYTLEHDFVLERA